MPSNKFFGKSKEDLVLLATLGRVLTPEKAEKMSQDELAVFLFLKDQELDTSNETEKITINREKIPLIKKEKASSTKSEKTKTTKQEKAPILKKEKVSKENQASVKNESSVIVSQKSIDKSTTKISKRELNKQLFMQELALKSGQISPKESSEGDIISDIITSDKSSKQASPIKSIKKVSLIGKEESADKITIGKGVDIDKTITDVVTIARSKKTTPKKEAISQNQTQLVLGNNNDKLGDTGNTEIKTKKISPEIQESMGNTIDTKIEAPIVEISDNKKSKTKTNATKNLKNENKQDESKSADSKANLEINASGTTKKTLDKKLQKTQLIEKQVPITTVEIGKELDTASGKAKTSVKNKPEVKNKPDVKNKIEDSKTIADAQKKDAIASEIIEQSKINETSIESEIKISAKEKEMKTAKIKTQSSKINKETHAHKETAGSKETAASKETAGLKETAALQDKDAQTETAASKETAISQEIAISHEIAGQEAATQSAKSPAQATQQTQGEALPLTSVTSQEGEPKSKEKIELQEAATQSAKSPSKATLQTQGASQPSTRITPHIAKAAHTTPRSPIINKTQPTGKPQAAGRMQNSANTHPNTAPQASIKHQNPNDKQPEKNSRNHQHTGTPIQTQTQASRTAADSSSKHFKNRKDIPERPIEITPDTDIINNEPIKDENSKETSHSARHSRNVIPANIDKMAEDNGNMDTPAEGDKRKHEKVVQPEVLEIVEGALEIMPDGYGFLRKVNYLQGPRDIYIPPQYIRRFGLRPGDWISGPGKLQRETDRYQAILYIKEVNGLPPEKMVGRPQFDQLTPIYPDERFILETGRNELSTRIIDLVAPIGKGQRGMIVSPPKAGKTILLQKIANAIATNNPEAKLIVLLIDERPEEVTDMQRSINGEVVYSTFDKTPENHVKVVELVLERAMRLVELGQDVVILLDSITRLARAYNLTINPTGRTLSGGLDPGALYGPKRFFGSARNIENGGSLTIIATSLIDTGSRMDEVIFEEFKGTGNMEVYLDRKLSEKRIFPAIDLNRSGTRREELLLTKRELDAVWTIRKAFGQMDTSAVTEMIINLLLKTNNNSHFVSSVNVSLNDKAMFDAMRGPKPGSNTGNTNANGSSNNYSSNNSNNYGN